MRKMVKKAVNWDCFHCEMNNAGEVEDDGSKIKVMEPIFFCSRCGVGNIPPSSPVLTHNAMGDWLGCLPLTGMAARVPNGKTPDGYMDVKFRYWSREAYKNHHAIDPELYIKWVKAGRPMGKAPGPTGTTIAPTGDEAAKLKSQELNGTIGRVEYLHRLKDLLIKNVVSQIYYDQEKKRILDEM